MKQYFSKQQGSMLIELLISMAIGVFLLYGALNVMLTTQKNSLARNVLADLDKNGRLAIELISNDVRNAGYLGCGSLNQHILNGVSFASDSYYTTASLDINEGLRGWEYLNTDSSDTLNYTKWNTFESFNSNKWQSGGVPSADKASVAKSSLDFQVAGESDVLRVWSVEPYVMEINSATSTQLNAVPETMQGFPVGAENKLLIVSDCKHSILVKAISFAKNGTVVLSDTVPSITALLASMKSPRAVMLRMVQYSLESSSFNSRPALVRRELTALGNFGSKVEILSSVMNMQILYGVNLDGNPGANAYLPAVDVADWKKVVSTRISMLLETNKERVSSSPVATNYYGKKYTTKDLRMRRGFTQTIALRNRISGVFN